jgi:AraC family transcriptional regulator
VKRRIASWSGMTADIVQATSSERIDYCYCGPRHMLVLFDQRVRREGETSVEGLPTSSLRDLSRKLIFVPAGRHYRDWQGSRSAARMVFFYFDPEPMPPLDSPSTGADRLLAPRLCFEDAQLLSTALKLTALIEGSDYDNRSYLEALGRVLAHELARNHKGNTPMKHTIRGGLAAWQQRVVTTYIEEHLAEPIALATLAELAGLSPYHFCRAFKQSFGLPPPPVSYEPAHRVRQGPSGETGVICHRNRNDGGIQRDELVLCGLSKGYRAYAERVSQRPCLADRTSLRGPNT